MQKALVLYKHLYKMVCGVGWDGMGWLLETDGLLFLLEHAAARQDAFNVLTIFA